MQSRSVCHFGRRRARIRVGMSNSGSFQCTVTARSMTAVFERHAGGIVTLAPGVPISAGGIPIDHLGVLPDERHLEQAVDRPVVDGNLPIAPLEPLIYLKLKSPRRRDEADVVELLPINDPKPIHLYLQRYAPDMLPKFDAAVTEAQV